MVVPFVYTEEEYKKLEEERDFFKEQATLWRNDYKNEYEENKNLKKELGKITIHSNMLESENILLKKECKARLERIKELENSLLWQATMEEAYNRVTELEEENRKLKLHIEAKDKAYTALLKDYEELKEDNKRLRAEIEEWLNAIRQKI